MKKMFKVFGIALLACSLLTVACQKDEDTSSTTTTNNSGNNGGGTNPTPNPNPNPNPNPDPNPNPQPQPQTGTMTFSWDNQVKELRAVEIQYYIMGEDAVQLFIDGSGNKTNNGQTDVVELPSYSIQMKYIGEQYSNAQPLDIMTDRVRIFSEEVADHMDMFTTPSQNGDGLVTLSTPDYKYVSHTKENLSYDMTNNTFSGTFTITLSSVYDEASGVSPIRQKTLTVTANQYPATPFQQGSKKAIRK